MKRKSELIQKEKSFDDKRKQGIKIISNFYLQPDEWIAVSNGRYKYEFKENSITEESVVDVNFSFDNYDNASMMLPYTSTAEKILFIWASSKPTNGLYCTIKIVNEVI